MFPFIKIGPIDGTEMKALLFAFVFSALFLVLLGMSAAVSRVTTRKVAFTVLTTKPLTKPLEPAQRSYGDSLERFRIVPQNFSQVDFKNFSYGIYGTSNGKPVSLSLTDGGMWDDASVFDLQDVYYKDITGDGSPEAIVRLLHLRCRGSCDGGSDLFFIYSSRNGKLKNIWQYETGSFAYGCGLKSFTLGNKRLTLQLFGQCARQATNSPGPAKFMVKDLTFILFKFDGSRFIPDTIDYVPEPARNLRNFDPEIRIY